MIFVNVYWFCMVYFFIKEKIVSIFLLFYCLKECMVYIGYINFKIIVVCYLIKGKE